MKLLTKVTGQVHLLGPWCPFPCDNRVVRLNVKAVVCVRLREGVQTTVSVIDALDPVLDHSVSVGQWEASQ